ncbi:MAG: ion transporter [candidate division WOR-3 bacterium]|nr:ion transporter [candidate division WOR-3 bacterium]
MNKYFEYFIFFLIILNAVLLGLETYPSIYQKYGKTIEFIDKIIVYIFVIELILRFINTKPKLSFIRDGWNVFDSFIILISLLPTNSAFSVLRIFRVLRIMLLITRIKKLKMLISALFSIIPSVSYIILLLIIMIYIYSIIGVHLFSRVAPAYFSDLSRAFITLFSVITLEGWFDIYLEIANYYSWAWIYFVSYILFGTFIVLNLFVGIIVNALSEYQQANKNSKP